MRECIFLIIISSIFYACATGVYLRGADPEFKSSTKSARIYTVTPSYSGYMTSQITSSGPEHIQLRRHLQAGCRPGNGAEANVPCTPCPIGTYKDSSNHVPCTR